MFMDGQYDWPCLRHYSGCLTGDGEIGMKRYQNWCLASHGHDMSEQEDGQFVKYTDHQQALAEKDRELQECADEYVALLKRKNDLFDKITHKSLLITRAIHELELGGDQNPRSAKALEILKESKLDSA